MKLVLATAFALSLLFNAGCTVHQLQHTKAKATKVQREGRVNLAASAAGTPEGRVGWGRVVLVPAVSIYIENDASLALVDAVGAALKAAGYNRAGATQMHAADAGMLKVEVNRLRFNNFTLPPILTTWANIELTLRLESLSGALLWQRRVKADATTWKFWDGYNRAATKTMNRLVKQMSAVFVEDDFYQATLRIKRHNDFVHAPDSPP